MSEQIETSLTSDLEIQFFKFICLHPSYFNSVKEEYFDDDITRELYKCVNSIFTKSENTKNKVVRLDENLLRRILTAMNPDLLENIDSKHNGILSHYETISDEVNRVLKGFSEEWWEEQLKSWCQWQQVRLTLEDVSLMYKNGYDKLRGRTDVIDPSILLNQITERVTRDLSMSFDNDDDIDFFDPKDHVIHQLKTYSTGYEFIDKCSDGGYFDGGLFVFAGAPKTGKTMVLHNLVARSVMAGNNTALVTLELSESLCLKRITSIMTDVKISEYNKLLKSENEDENVSQDKVREVLERSIDKSNLSTFTSGNTGLIPASHGDLRVKGFPTSTMTVSDLENYLLKKERKLTIKYGKPYKFKTIFIDYINIMKNAKNPNSENLYLKIKQLSEDLRAMAKRNEWCVITATQTNRNQVESNTMFMSDISESHGLNATVDMLFGIIKTVDMDANSVMDIKCVLSRVAGYTNYRKEFLINKEHLRITENMNVMEYLDDSITNTLVKGFGHGNKKSYSENVEKYTSFNNASKKTINAIGMIASKVQEQQSAEQYIPKNDKTENSSMNDSLEVINGLNVDVKPSIQNNQSIQKQNTPNTFSSMSDLDEIMKNIQI